ncbi:histidine kinase [Nonomuraea sp. NPDC049419]|uniref:sensor histidine kinase n=1 Tax=Nonomuraea sp. NPDC049419 TaxID=3155772 RepID=UPI003438C406
MRTTALVLIMAVSVHASTVMAYGNQPHARPLDLLGHALLAATALGLALLPRRPRLALAVCAVAAAVIFTRGYAIALWPVPALIALFSAIAAGRRAAGWAGAAFLVAVPGVAALGRMEADVALAVLVWLLLVLVVAQPAEVSRARRAYTREVERRAAQAERSREEEALRRAQEERLRVARELHDVTSHTVSVIALHAAVAAEAVERAGGPPEAAAALQVIRTSSRQALGEMKAVLGVLRPGTSGHAPQPGSAQLPRLLETAGLPVSFDVEGERRPLPPAADLTVYRVVQEALTNTMRHAGAGAATVRLTYEPGAVTVQVEDDGRGIPSEDAACGPPGQDGPADGPGDGPGDGPDDGPGDGPGDGPVRRGHGLTGMAERVAALGGRLATGNAPGGGFRVTARLPT